GRRSERALQQALGKRRRIGDDTVAAQDGVLVAGEGTSLGQALADQHQARRSRPLLQSAPPVFDADGSWVPERHVAALLVADLIIWPRPPASALPDAWKERAIEILLRRPDGMAIALGCLALIDAFALGESGRVNDASGHAPYSRALS